MAINSADEEVEEAVADVVMALMSDHRPMKVRQITSTPKARQEKARQEKARPTDTVIVGLAGLLDLMDLMAHTGLTMLATADMADMAPAEVGADLTSVGSAAQAISTSPHSSNP